MMTFVGIIHIVVALVLIILVLIQDSKSDGALGMGGSSGSNSLLGATGAQTLAGKLTVWAAIIFALSCLTLSIMTASKSKSVVDGLALPATAPVTAPADTTTAPATAPAENAAPAASPAAPAQN